MTESDKYLCPNCGKPVSEDECNNCGWVPGMYMTDDEIQSAVFQFLDESSNPNSVTADGIASTVGCTTAKALAFKREFLKEHNLIAEQNKRNEEFVKWLKK